MADLTRTQLRIADLPTRKPTTFDLTPDANARSNMAAALGIPGIRKLKFTGEVTPVGSKDWALQARLGATVVQSCVVTLEPVTTRIDEDVQRSYIAAYLDAEGEEVEMPEDDTIEPLPAVIDLMGVMTEALALSLPAYPRAKDAALDDAVYTEPGATPMTDEDAKPFAGLGALRDALAKDGDKDR